MSEVLTLEYLQKMKEAFNKSKIPEDVLIIGTKPWLEAICDEFGVSKDRVEHLGDGVWGLK